MASMCERLLDDSGSGLCNERATNSFVITDNGMKYQIMVCPKHHAERNQTGAKMRVAAKPESRLPQHAPGHNTAYVDSEGGLRPGMGGYGALD